MDVELEAIGLRRRYDPRPYADLGIEAEPQQHLTRRLAFLAACGASPEKDVENGHKGWWAHMVALLKQHAEMEKAEEERFADLHRTSVEGPEESTFLADLARELAQRRAEARTTDVILSILHPMARSNADQIAEKMRGHAADLADKLRAKDKIPEVHPRYVAFAQREPDAHAYLDNLEKAVAHYVAFAKSLTAHAQIGRDRIEMGS